MGGRVLFDNGSSESCGVAIFFSRNLDLKIKKCDKSGYGRFLIVEAEVNGHDLELINLYTPNKDDTTFFQTVMDLVAQCQDSLFKVWGGDLNIILNRKLDRKSFLAQGRQTNSEKLINEFLDREDWVDLWRVLHPEETQYTWFRKKPVVMSRLDYFLIPQESIGNVVECKISAGLLTDHSLVSMITLLKTSLRGRGYWKLNMAYLENINFVDEMNKLIDTSIEKHKYKTLSMRWEILKIEITELAQFLSKKEANVRKQRREGLEKKLNTQQKRLSCINLKGDGAVKLIEAINIKIDKIKEGN